MTMITVIATDKAKTMIAAPLKSSMNLVVTPVIKMQWQAENLQGDLIVLRFTKRKCSTDKTSSKQDKLARKSSTEEL